MTMTNLRLFLILLVFLPWCICNFNFDNLTTTTSKLQQRHKRSPDDDLIEDMKVAKLNKAERIKRTEKIKIVISAVDDLQSLMNSMSFLQSELKNRLTPDECFTLASTLESRLEEIKKLKNLNKSETNEFIEHCEKFIANYRNAGTHINHGNNQMAAGPTDITLNLFKSITTDLHNNDQIKLLSKIVDQTIKKKLDYSAYFEMAEELKQEIIAKKKKALTKPSKELNEEFFTNAKVLLERITKKANAEFVKHEENAKKVQFGDAIDISIITDIRTLNLYKQSFQHYVQHRKVNFFKVADAVEEHIEEIMSIKSNTREARHFQSEANHFIRYLRNRASIEVDRIEAEANKRDKAKAKAPRKRNNNNKPKNDDSPSVNKVLDADAVEPIASTSKQEVNVKPKPNINMDNVNVLPHVTAVSEATISKSPIKPTVTADNKAIKYSDPTEIQIKPIKTTTNVEILPSTSKHIESPEYIKSISIEDKSKIMKTLIDSVENIEDLNRLKYVFDHILIQSEDDTIAMKLIFEIDSQRKKMTDQNRKNLFNGVIKLLTNYGITSVPLSNVDLSPEDMRKIFKTLVNKVVKIEDLNCLKYVLDHILIQQIDESSLSLMADDLAKRMNKIPKSQHDTLYKETEKLHKRLSSKIQTFKIIAKLFNNEHDLTRLRDLLPDMDGTSGSQIAAVMKQRIKEMPADAPSALLKEAKKLINDLEQLGDTGKGTKRKITKKTSVMQCLSSRRKRSSAVMACHYSWQDIERFNEATDNHALAEIRINSYEFLEILAHEESTNHMKAQQLVEFAQELQNSPMTRELITGDHKMLVRDVLEQNGLTALRQKQRLAKIITNLSKQTPAKKLPPFRLASKTMAISAATAIPFIKGVYATIITCLERSNGTSHDCLMSIAALTVSVLPLGAGLVALRLIPWTAERLAQTALLMLPSTTSLAIRNAAAMHVYSGVTRGAAAFLHILAVLPLGFDVYNIVEMSKIINMCSQQGNACLSKDKISFIISLTFSCVSIAVFGGLMLSGVGFAAGALIGLAMVVIESLAMGINAVVYYKNKYQTHMGENIRIFFYTIAYQPLPTDVESLIRRTDWINDLQKNIIRLLDSDKNIVAYAMGIGKFDNNRIVPAGGLINMMESNDKYTMKLSRVIPIATNDTTLLCLPKIDNTLAYDYYPTSVKTATYKCHNTFVIADKQRWNNKSNDKSYIAYDLDYIDNGNIIGSNTFNNLFLISNGTDKLNVIGGVGNITNFFIIRHESFRGNIMISSTVRSNVIDLTTVNASLVNFTWKNQLTTPAIGRVQFNDNDDDVFYVYTPDKTANLHIIGRAGKVDVLQCNQHGSSAHLTAHQRGISVDSHGGESSTRMDLVANCEVSVVRPFTRIVGGNSPNDTYTAHLWLEYDNSLPISYTATATIEPQQSTFILVFIDRPLFSSFHRLHYHPKTKNLTWTLRNDQSSILLLTIVSYNSGILPQQPLTTLHEITIDPVNCIFIDGYYGSTITPVLTSQPVNGNTTITVKHFNIFSTVNSSQLEEVIQYFKEISIHQPDDLIVVTQLKYPLTNQTFTFGSISNDRFFIDNNSLFLGGRDGSDIYVLNKQSPKCVVIDNGADDDLLDTLILLDNTCDYLYAKLGPLEGSCSENTLDDVTLFCSMDNTTIIHNHTQVILRNYFMDSDWQHLQIFWHNSMHLLLPYEWIAGYRSDFDASRSENVELALLLSFDSSTNGGALTLTSDDTYVVLNITNENDNPLVAYRLKADVILARKYFSGADSLYIVLEGFFINNTNHIDPQWRQTWKFIVNDTILRDSMMPKVLDASDIKQLYLATLANDKTNQQDNQDFLKEYRINITNEQQTIIIQHNHNLSVYR